MNVLIVGLGSMGQRHLNNLKVIEPSSSVTVWRHAEALNDNASHADGADRIVYSLQDALKIKPKAAIICCPASRHVETAMKLAQEGIHLLIEKPISNNAQGVEELIRLCDQQGTVLMVGYNFRFYPPFLAIKKALGDGKIGRILAIQIKVGQYLPDWRASVDYKKSVSARRELGGGALLELSHELDYARWFTGEARRVSARMGKVSDLEIDVEDIAEATIDFENGALGHIHLDMIQRSPVRTCCITGSEGTLTWDGEDHRVRQFRAQEGWRDIFPSGSLDKNTMYLKELAHFFECVRTKKNPLVTGEDGKKTLEMVLACKQSASEGRVVGLCEPSLA